MKLLRMIGEITVFAVAFVGGLVAFLIVVAATLHWLIEPAWNWIDRH